MREKSLSFLKIIIISLVLGVSISACKKSEEISPNDQFRKAKLALLDTMRLWYYWNDQIPNNVDVSQYATPKILLDAFKNSVDRFSFIDENGAFANQLKGIPKDYGFASSPFFRIDANGNYRFGAVYKESPLGKEGISRGAILRKIGGQVPNSNNLATELGKESNVFEVQFLDGSIKTVTISQANYNSDPILFKTVFNENGKRIAYLVFNNFLYTGANANESINNAINRLNQIFGEFKQAGVSELILDLRYNGGGYSRVAAHLANLIAPNTANGRIYSQQRWNSVLQREWERQGLNVRIFYRTQPNTLNINQVVIITTGRTASASEQVINNLRPYTKVITVGTKTYGKPAFNLLFDYKPENEQALGFYLTLGVEANANGEGRFFDGLAATITASDDATREFGNKEEASLAQALRYISTGVIPTGGARIEEKDSNVPDIGAIRAWNIIDFPKLEK